MFALVGFAILAYSGSAQANPPPSDAVSVDAVIQKYIDASGGSELAGIQTEARKGTLVRGLSGQVPLETIAKARGQWRYTQTFAWGDQVSYICDGTHGWVVDTEGISEMDARQRADLQLLLDVQAPLRLREFYSNMEIKGNEGAADEQPTQPTVVVARSPEGLVTELAFDRETGLLVRAGSILFEDYRDVGQIKRPFRVRLGETREDATGESHLQMVMQFTEITHGVAVDDSLFRRPGCVLPPKDPPLFTPRREVEVGIPALEACVGVYRHPSDSTVTYAVTRQENHLMIERTGWGQKLEIKPESEIDYFMEFLNRDFRFVKDPAGEVVRLDIIAPGGVPIMAPKMK